MSIVCFPRYSKNVGSSRVRTYNMFVNGEKIYPYFDNYLYGKRIGVGYYIRSYITRMWLVLTAEQDAIFFIEKELIPGAPYWLELFLLRRTRFILDFDDAVWATSTMPWKYSIIASRAEVVLGGSIPIVNYFKAVNNKTYYIPSSVNFGFSSDEEIERNCLVWIGSNSTTLYIYNWLNRSKGSLDSFTGEICLVGSSDSYDWKLVKKTKRVKWSINNEIAALKRGSIGVMPMEKEYFSIFKCSYKSLLYASNGLKVFHEIWGQNRWFSENFSFFYELDSFDIETDETYVDQDEFQRFKNLVEIDKVRDKIYEILGSLEDKAGEATGEIYCLSDIYYAESISLSKAVFVPKNSIQLWFYKFWLKLLISKIRII
jgi:hypothetical protein